MESSHTQSSLIQVLTWGSTRKAGNYKKTATATEEKKHLHLQN